MKLSDNYGQTIDFNIPEEYNKIVVNCSGGADSSVLLFMIAKYLKDNNRTQTKLSVLTCANDKKHRWNARKAADVINYIIDKLKWNQFDMHYVYYRDVQDVKYFHEVEAKLFLDGRVDLIMGGITSNPNIPGPLLVESASGEKIDIVKEALPERNTKGKEIDMKKNGTVAWYAPFINVDKRFVAAMYKQNNVMDMLNLTRSCEAIPDVSNKKYNPEFENTPCGNCWWCLERKWAFGKF
jgi:7-cyano-7-deazaguanine synthase in queuosine biosynthesis